MDKKAQKMMLTQPFTLQEARNLYSDKTLGYSIIASDSMFRLFAPRAFRVSLVLFDNYTDTQGVEFPMVRDEQGVWEYSMTKPTQHYYGYRVCGPEEKPEHFNGSIIIADPYSQAVVTHNTYSHRAKSIILDTHFDWSDDTFSPPADHRELIIYECHIRDMTMHPSAEIQAKGTYTGFVEYGKKGGLSSIKELGINAVELLPIHEFANIEPPYNDASVKEHLGLVNTWNPYSRNHWGYMTSFFFAPESYYASDGSIVAGEYSGTEGKSVHELKTMIKTLHKEGIAVILDVVYNHVSHYDENPLKYCDKFLYFRCNENGEFIGNSGCGNDVFTESPMARRLIIDSVRFWLEEYNVDGFRFDLAAMIDTETCRLITQTARAIKPNVIIIAEPWGGGSYDIERYASLGWKAWNDIFRNGIKGQNPYNGQGAVFGHYFHHHTPESLLAYMTGTLQQDGFIFPSPDFSINYLESHDDMTLGDFIRIAIGEYNYHARIENVEAHAKLTSRQQSYHKLAAVFLCISQGCIMIHQGQEYGRSKIIAWDDAVQDPSMLTLDHNSYNKDNATNYLNYTHRDYNQALWKYYQGLFSLRTAMPFFFGQCPRANISLSYQGTPHQMTVRLVSDQPNPYAECLIIINTHPEQEWFYTLQEGEWACFTNAEKSSSQCLEYYSGSLTIPPISAYILMQ